MEMNEQTEVEQLRKLVRDYYRLLHVIHDDHWRAMMTPFWIEQKDKLQQRAQALIQELK